MLLARRLDYRGEVGSAAYALLVTMGHSGLAGRLQALLRLLETCRGRGCRPGSMAAAMVYYVLRWAGVRVEPSGVYNYTGNGVSVRIPRQSFHNSLNMLLARLGHSPAFKRVLYGELGARVCRWQGSASVAWEAYGHVEAPRCIGVEEHWPGPPGPPVLWVGGHMSIKIKAEFNVYGVIARLREAFGSQWFTASDAAEVLLVSTNTASRLLGALEELSYLESVRVEGKNMKRYRVK